MRTSMMIASAALFLAVSSTALACDDAHKAKKVTIDAGSAPRATGGLVLHLEDVRVQAGEAAVLRVFVNHAEATAGTPTTHEKFVDELFIVPAQTSSSGKTQRHDFTLALPASAAISAGDRVTVTLVPIRDDNGTARETTTNVKVKSARVTAR